MSIRATLARRINQVFHVYMGRIFRLQKVLSRIGGEDAVKVIRYRAIDGGRAQWRRWYKANRKHQRQLRAIRQAGGRIGMWPHSLSREMVP